MKNGTHSVQRPKVPEIRVFC